ncbi:MAG TPA: hypothetical protein VGD08_07855 [Stellaceae bacterium]
MTPAAAAASRRSSRFVPVMAALAGAAWLALRLWEHSLWIVASAAVA